MSSQILESTAFSPEINAWPTPLHLFTPSLALEDAQNLEKGLRSQIPQIELFYSAKTNGLPPLLQSLLAKNWGLELVCPKDVTAAVKAGAKGNQILFNGAAFTPDQLNQALFTLQVEQITLDSPAMLELLLQCLGSSKRERPPLRVALRVHDGNSHFGFPRSKVELEKATSLLRKNKISLVGLHLHKNPQGSARFLEEAGLDFQERAQILSALASELDQIAFLDLGGGIDSPWIYRLRPEEMAGFHNPVQAGPFHQNHHTPRFSLEAAGATVAAGINAGLGPHRNRWRIQLELGRSVCTRALSTLLEVRAVKENFYPDAQVVITDGNTAILGPLHRAIHPIHAQQEGKIKTFVYGNLPHSADWLYQSVLLPKLKGKDRLLVKHTGAYFLAMEAEFGFEKPPILNLETFQREERI